MPKITNDWLEYIGAEFEKDYYLKLKDFLKNEYENETIFPKKDDIFNAFHYTPVKNLKVLLIGQDPL